MYISSSDNSNRSRRAEHTKDLFYKYVLAEEESGTIYRVLDELFMKETMPIDWGIVYMTLVDNFPEIHNSDVLVSAQAMIDYMESEYDTYFREWFEMNVRDINDGHRYDFESTCRILRRYYYDTGDDDGANGDSWAKDIARVIFLNNGAKG